MAAGTIIDIKAGMEYDNAPTLSITTFFMLWRFTRLHQFRVALRVKVFFFIIRAVQSNSRSPAASKHRLLYNPQNETFRHSRTSRLFS